MDHYVLNLFLGRGWKLLVIFYLPDLAHLRYAFTCPASPEVGLSMVINYFFPNLLTSL